VAISIERCEGASQTANTEPLHQAAMIGYFPRSLLTFTDTCLLSMEGNLLKTRGTEEEG
jgi:hypothetical protein